MGGMSAAAAEVRGDELESTHVLQELDDIGGSAGVVSARIADIVSAMALHHQSQIGDLGEERPYRRIGKRKILIVRMNLKSLDSGGGGFFKMP